MKVTILAAVNEAGYIGKDNKLMYKIPQDMIFFKGYTINAGHVIMGRKTHESIGKDLPHRQNHVISRANGKGALADKIAELESAGVEEVCIIGGGELYKAAEEYATNHIITVIKDDTVGDTRYECPLEVAAEQYAFQSGVTEEGHEWYAVNSEDLLAAAIGDLPEGASIFGEPYEVVSTEQLTINSTKHLLTDEEKDADVEVSEADKANLYQPDPHMTALLEFLQSLNHTEPCYYNSEEIMAFLKMMASEAVLSDDMITAARIVMDAWDGESGQALITAIFGIWTENSLLLDEQGTPISESIAPTNEAIEAVCGVGVQPADYIHECALGCREDWWEDCRDITPISDIVGVIEGAGIQHTQHIEAIFGGLVHKVPSSTIYEMSDTLSSGIERMLELDD